MVRENASKLTIISLAEDAIDINLLVGKLTLPNTGAVVIFTGTVRSVSTVKRRRLTTHLEYEAFDPMAIKKLQQIANEIRKEWPSIEGLAIIQRIGRVDAGAITTVVACSAAHRNTGIFEAAHYGIDRVKEIVPVWKKEIGPGGEEWIEGHYHPQPGE